MQPSRGLGVEVRSSRGGRLLLTWLLLADAQFDREESGKGWLKGLKGNCTGRCVVVISKADADVP